jgi:outer membrane protein assembly factor BamB
MKLKPTLILVLILAGILMSACSDGGVPLNNWPGVAGSENGDVILVALGDRVSVVNAVNGTLRFSFPAEPSNTITFFAPPAISGDLAVAGSFQGVLYGFNAQSGTVGWTFEGAGGRWVAGIQIMDGMIFAPNSDYTLYVLNSSGEPQWTFETAGALWASTVIDETHIYQASMDHSLYALNRESHDLDWSVDLGGALVRGPIVGEDGTLYIGTIAGGIFALDPSDGSILWQQLQPAGIWSQPLVVGDALYFGDQQGRVVSLAIADGRELWSIDLGSPIVINPIVYGEGFLLTTEDGQATLINWDGTRAWTQTIDGQLMTDAIITGENAVMAVTKGSMLLQAISPTGALLWNFSLSE